MMKTYLKMLVISVLMVSCQADKKEDISLSSIVEKEKTSQYKDIKSTNDEQSKTTLSKAQFNDFFPKQIGAYKLINVSVLMSSDIASALYVADNDYDHSMIYSLEDGNRKGSAILRNFEVSYNLKNQGPLDTKYIYTERNSYKTIAFLQPEIKRNDIRFIYNNRFRITLEGTEDIDDLWSFIKKEDLKKLNNN